MDTQFRDERLDLRGHFAETSYPPQAFGSIAGHRFCFRASGRKWTFAAVDDNSNVSEPALIFDQESGFLRKGLWDDSVEQLEARGKAMTLILRCAQKFLEHLKTAPRKYQDRIVAFIDIIGFKEIVDRTVMNGAYFNEIVDAITEIRKQFIEHPASALQKLARDVFYDPFDNPDYRTQVIQVSDCMIISKLAGVRGSLEKLVLDTSLAIHILICRGLLCRGCIEMGKTYHTGEYIIGPAYNAAYSGEQVEWLPAITLSKTLYAFGLRNRSNSQQEIKYFDTFVVPHTPGRYFIDYFNDLDGYTDVLETPVQHYGKLRGIIQREYSRARDYKIKGKYLWMIDRFNSSGVVRNKQLKRISK